MNMDKLLTLIIPTYNMERYLSTCLDSLLVGEQQAQLEVLVVNDGSKDGSSAIAHQYMERHPETFRVIDKENGNYGSCINRGLKEMTGKFVKVLDADDHFNTDELRKLLQKLATVDSDLLLTDNTIFGDNDISKKYYGFPFTPEVEMAFTDICGKDEFKGCIQMHHVTYNRRIFEGFSYHQTEGISYTDMEWIFLPMSRVATVTYLPLPLYCYLVGREGQTVAPQQMKRSAEHQAILVNDLLTHYEQADKSTPSICDYLNFRLARQVKYLYRIYLAEFPGMDCDKLVQIDQRLQQVHPALYEEVGRRTMGPFIRIHYVRYWRRHGYAAQPKYFYTLFNAYNKTLNFTKKLLGIYNV